MKRYIEILRKTVSVIVVTFLFVQFFTVSPLISEENSSDTNITENQTTETVDNNENNTNNTDPSNGDVNNEDNDEVTPGDNTDSSNPTDVGDVTDPNDNTDLNENNDQSDVTDNTDINIQEQNTDVKDNSTDNEVDEYDIFTETVNDVVVTVKANKGVFPEGSTLSVVRVPVYIQRKVNEAIEEVRNEDTNVVVSYTFDIKILDIDGNEVQPKDMNKVKVSFAHEKIQDSELSTNVYHIKEEGNQLTAETLEVEIDGDTATVETDSFSYYTVEFTYGDKQYVLEGDGVVKLDDLLTSIGIEGNVKGISVSNNELFNVILADEDGVKYITTYSAEKGTVTRPVNNPKGSIRYVASYQPFTTQEWMDVLMDDGTKYHIIVTDANMDNGEDTRSVPGLYQGAGSTFADSIPVADIWINQSMINMSEESRNSAIFIPGDLMTSGNHPGFIAFDAASEGYTDYSGNTAGHAGYMGNLFIEFDTRLETLDGEIETTKNSDGSKVYQSYNYFDGTVGTFKWENAAIRLNDQGQEEYLDVYVEYYNPMITIETPENATSAASIDDAVLGLFGGNMIALGGQRASGDVIDSSTGALGFRYGLDIKVRPYVADKLGNIVSGKFFYPMVHLNVDRTPYSGFKMLYGANDNYANYDPSLHMYSEQVKIENGLVQNLDGDIVYIKGGNGDSMNYYSKVDYDNGQYTIYPGSTGAPGSARYDFYQGFLTLVENGVFYMNYNAASSPTARSSIETFILAGTDFNYRLRHTTETLPSSANPNPASEDGGTIQTTRYGNHSGELDDGEIIDPAVIATATGQTVTYTFYPKQGYGLRELWVWNDTVTTYGNTSAETQKAYEWSDGADRYAWNESDQNWHSVGHYNLTSNPENYDWTEGIYTYKYDSVSGDWNKIGTYGTTLTRNRRNSTWSKEVSGVEYTYIYDNNDDKWKKYESTDLTNPIAEEEPPVDATTLIDTVSEPPSGSTTDLGPASSVPPATATNVFPTTSSMQNGATGRRIYEGSGNDQYQAFDDDNDGNVDRYVYTFSGINSDNAIHVVWGQTILNITKRTTGTGSVDENGNALVDTFTFQIKAWGDKDGDGTDEYIDFTNASDDPRINARFTPTADNFYVFTLRNGETLGISPESIPVGYQWQIEEIHSRPSDSQYGTTYDDWTPVGSATKSGTFEVDNQSQSAVFTNNRKKVIDPERKLIVKKVWTNDTEQLRPNRITVTIEKTPATGVSAANFKSALISRVSTANIKSIQYGTKQGYDNASNKGILQATQGSGNIYFYAVGNDVYFYSDAKIYLSGSAEDMFYNMVNLENISGLAYLHTDYVTSMKRMFGNDRKITDLSALSDWVTTNVTDMEKMFAPDTINSNASTQMTLKDLSPLQNWETQNVTTMRYMFRGAGYDVTDVSPLAGWDVSRVTTFQDMFFRTCAASTDSAKALEAWDVGRATTFQGMFNNASATQTPGLTQNLPNWTNSDNPRAGYWSSGTYIAKTPYRESDTPTNPNNRPSEAEFWASNAPKTISQTVHDVDPNDSNVWIYEFDVDPDTKWSVYEMLPDSVKELYTCSAEGVDGRGMKADPVKGAEPGTETVLTNTRKEYKLRIKKDTDVSTTDKFKFTLTLWTGTTEMAHPYNLPDDHRLIQTGVFTKTADGTYTFEMGSPASQELFLPAGVRYRVIEESKTGWSLTSSHNTHGYLNELKEASFLNTQADLFNVVKIWEGDSSNNIIYKTRPTGEKSLGIVVTTIDQSVSGRLKIKQGQDSISIVNNEDSEFTNLSNLYNASSDSISVLYDTTGDSKYKTTAAKKVQIDSVDYALDKISDSEFKLMKIESGDHKGSRWKRNGTIQEIQNSNPQYNTYRTRYESSSVSVTDVRDTNGTTAIPTTAAKIIEVSGVDYVYDLNGTTYKVIPVENVPFTKEYKTADTFLEDDGAGGWLYEYNIPDREDIVSVVETNIPQYYQKLETVTDADGEVSYQITNTLQTRDLTVKKTTVDNEPGEFNFGIKFWIENDTSERHPVKVGHSQILTTQDGQGNTVYEYEFVFEEGVTLDGVDVYGPHEVIGDETIAGTLTKTQAESLVNTLKSITVGAPDQEFGRHNSTNITLANLGLAWNNDSTFDLFVEQKQDFITNMMTNGRRLDWFIIPTPHWYYNGSSYDSEENAYSAAITDNGDGTYTYNNQTYQTYDEAKNAAKSAITSDVITVRTPYSLDNKPKPSGVTGTYGTYYFTLQNGGSVTFTDLPMGVSYDIVEYKKSGWDEKNATNKTGTLTDNATEAEVWIYNHHEYATYEAAENAGGTSETITKKYKALVSTFTNEREKGTIKVVKETVDDIAGTFKFRAMTGRVVDPANVKDQNGSTVSITRIYPEGKIKRIENDVVTTEHQTYVAYLTTEGRYRLYKDGHVTLDVDKTNDPANGQDIGQLFNYIYPCQFTTMDGMNYKFDYIIDPESGSISSTLTVETTTFEFNITKDNDETTNEYVTIDGIPFGSRDKIWELPDSSKWRLISVDDDTSKTEIDTTMSTDQTVTHTFLNERLCDLNITKKVTGNMGDKFKEFEFNVKVWNETPDEEKVHLIVHVLKNADDSITLVTSCDNISVNNHLVSEDNKHDLYEYFSSLNDRNIVSVSYEGKDYIAVLRIHDYNDGTSARNIYVYDPEVALTYLNDSITETIGTSIEYLDLSEFGGESNGDGSYKFKLKHNEDIKIEDIIYGYKYEIIEEDYSNIGYITKVDGAETRAVNGELKDDVNHTFENQNGAVVPTKAFAGYFMPIIILNFIALCYVLYDRRRKRLDILDE